MKCVLSFEDFTKENRDLLKFFNFEQLNIIKIDYNRAREHPNFTIVEYTGELNKSSFDIFLNSIVEKNERFKEYIINYINNYKDKLIEEEKKRIMREQELEIKTKQITEKYRGELNLIKKIVEVLSNESDDAVNGLYYEDHDNDGWNTTTIDIYDFLGFVEDRINEKIQKKIYKNNFL
ncbi:MAG: hypothetical protein UR43_C0020G0002 [candidate division TM6 bacterium GW2011_GWF2_33_332]|nr:MAG: hypothetical protein UR43_C0020G0002 [candidate division TM6 bacterium GW2011_GWF2_33_332]